MEHQHVGADSETARLRLVYQFRLGHPYPYPSDQTILHGFVNPK